MEFILGLLALLLAGIALLGPVVAIALVIALWRQVGRLQQRVQELESRREIPAWTAEGLQQPAGAEAEPEVTVLRRRAVESEPSMEIEPAVVTAALAEPHERPAPINWELLIGRKALGWVAVVLLLFGFAFFLRYAYENQWIGPVGRVAIGLLVGLGLTFAGWVYHRRNWRIFSQMLSSAGMIVLYLAVFSSFGFYSLLPQYAAGFFLLVVVIESALLAVLYRAPALAWMSLIGGLLTPLLMTSETDQYQALFIYLAALSVGVLVLAHWKHWRGLGTVALLGVHGLFWMWYEENYHSEKMHWALGFQLAVFLVFVGHSLIAHVFSFRRASYEDLCRLLLNAFLWFAAAFVMLRTDWGDWMGLLAVSMAMGYVVLGRVMLMRRPEEERQLLAALAAAVGFIGLAFPIQAGAEWVALGWAAEAAALWWFGLRCRSGVLRAMACGLMLLAVGRLVTIDTWTRPTIELRWPILNLYALPALGVAACLLTAVGLSRRYLAQWGWLQRVGIGVASVVGILLLWFVLSVDLYDYFRTQAIHAPEESVRWRWLGQMTLSALWAGYAMAVLSMGFVRRLPTFRWTALLLFALTIGKVFFFDMSGLDEVYRILAFLIVAVVLGLAGWFYQRQMDRQPAEVSDYDEA